MNSLLLAGATFCTSKAGLVTGTTSTLTHALVNFCVNGKAFTKAAATNAASPTVDFATKQAFRPLVANRGTIFVVGSNPAGALLACQGSIESLNAAGEFVAAPSLPTLPNDMCPIGYVIVRAGSSLSGSWLFGANNWSVTGITVITGDLMAMPNRPFAS